MADQHVGFTGSRHGMTAEQASELKKIMASLGGWWFHHGDCLGADAEAHKLAQAASMSVAVHPPLRREFRAFCNGDFFAEPKDYLARNRDIVDASKGLIATPSGHVEEVRSGTWTTIRYARKVGKPLIIIWPDGSRKNEHGAQQ